MNAVTAAVHARAFDLPGWPCPPRVRDIPNHENSWGMIPTYDIGARGIVQDELGYLWADGNAVPAFGLPNAANQNPGVVVFWTPHGLGLWVHPKSLSYLGNLSRLEMEPDRWVPVAMAAADLPEFVKQ